MASVILSVVALLFSVAALAYSVKVALVYHRFNEQVKDWANALDASARDAIDRSARQILRELDERMQEQREEENNNNEQNIVEENEES